jgi:hypothetical protein
VIARNHHYLPQCYPKGFVRHRGKAKLFVVDMKTRKTFTTSTRNIAAEKDFHSVKEKGQISDLMERAFSKFESDLSIALNNTINKGTVSDAATKNLLLNFVTMIAVKNPRNRATFGQARTDLARRIMELVSSSDEIWNSEMARARKAGAFQNERNISREEMVEFLERGEYTVQVSTQSHLTTELGILDKILPIIAARHWTLLRAPKDSLGFVASDHPVCLFWSEPYPPPPPMFPPGYGMRKTDILFPISSGLAWLGRFQSGEEVIEVSEEYVRHFNASVISMAVRQVYGQDGDCGYQAAPWARQRRLRELLTDNHLGAIGHRAPRGHS